MTIKVKYENGILRPLQEVNLVENEIYEVEVAKRPRRALDLRDLRGMIGIASFGGDALEDSEKLYDQ